MESAYINAMMEWQQILDVSNILNENSDLRLYQLSTLGEEYKTLSVLKPKTIHELSQCLKIANKYGIKIFPISRGKNHGYNSAAPLTDNTVIIDLQFINQILEYSQEFGYIVIEPGVTFGELYKFLGQEDSEYMMSGFSGSNNASVVANALERGIGRGIFGNRSLSTEIKEVMLPDGTRVNLRQHYQNQDLTADFQYSMVGLDFGNLFYQSNLAIVTKMIIYLEAIPEYLAVVSVKVNTEPDVFNLIDILRKMVKMNLISPVFSIINDVRLLVGSGLYKKKDRDLFKNTDSWLKDFSSKSKLEFGKWNLSFSLQCCCEEEVLLKEKLINHYLEKLPSSISFNYISKSQSKALIKQSLLDDFVIKSNILPFLFNLGYTNESDQKTLYWDSKIDSSQRRDPITDGCGLIFFTPKIPFNRMHIEKSLHLLKTIAKKYDMETPITFQFKTKAFACMILPILFDLTDTDSRKKAHLYHRELLEAFTHNGYFPSRLTSLSVSNLFNENNELKTLIKKIKTSFDEYNIMSPKRYEY